MSRTQKTRRRRLLAAAAAVAAIAVGGVAVTTSGAATNTGPPVISGVAQEGRQLTSTIGTWSADGDPDTYTIRWQRCNPDGSACVDIAGAQTSIYTLVLADVGRTVRSVVTATDGSGPTSQPSAVSATVAVEAIPTISGIPADGQILTAVEGLWSGPTPITYTYQWSLCDATGGACVAIVGATAKTYTLTASAVGKTVRVTVTGTDAGGSSSVTSVPSAVVADAGPTSLVKLASGQTSIAAADVKLPARLSVSKFRVQDTQPLRSRAPFRVTFTVVDTRGYVVRDALVYVIGLPYNRIQNVREARTGQDGTATITLTPTRLQPLKLGARLVLFARARVEGDQLLAGASSRRLVEVVFGAAS